MAAHTLLVVATLLFVYGPAKSADSINIVEHTQQMPNASLFKATTDVQTTTPQIFNGPLSSYLKKREHRTNVIEFKYRQTSKPCADDETPLLTIMCITKHYETDKRNSIRNTWGQIARDGRWPGSDRIFTGIKLIFLLGHPPGHPSKHDTAINDEGNTFGDLVQADFVDSTFNASAKILAGLDWIKTYCPKTRFILRVGEDQFVHVANLITYLESLDVSEKGLIVGKAVKSSTVIRKGAWGVSKTLYPYNKYPPCVVRSSYVISGELAAELYSTAQYMPYIFIEDVYLTGILRQTVGASVVNNDGFVGKREPKPKLCGFHNDFRISSNTNPRLSKNLWKSLSRDLDNCYVAGKQ